MLNLVFLMNGFVPSLSFPLLTAVLYKLLISQFHFNKANRACYLQRYLIPKSQTNSGVTPEKVQISEEALSTLIKSYCRESGVRNLEKQIEKVSSFTLHTVDWDNQISMTVQLH